MPVADIILHRFRKQGGILQNHAESVAQIAHFVIAQIVPVQRDAAVRHIIKARQQIDQGRLAGAGGAHDGDLSPRGDFQRDIL